LAAGDVGATTISGGNLAFGSAEGIIHTAAGHDLTITSNMTGSNGFTKSGPAALTLSGNNTFSGGAGISLNGGTLIVSSESNLGGASNPITMGGGALRPAAAFTSLAGTHPITLNSKSGGFDVPTSQTFTV